MRNFYPIQKTLGEALVSNRKFKCPHCRFKGASRGFLEEHVKSQHSHEIEEGITVRQHLYHLRLKKTRGYCVIDRKETDWNEDKGKYELLCSDKCRKKFRKRFQENCKKKLGTDNPASTPEHQMKAIAGRKTSGEYTFKDGTKVGYSSSYEQDFLRFMEEEMKWSPLDVTQCYLIFHYGEGEGASYHIPDFYIPSLNCIINIKDGGDNPNNAIPESVRNKTKLGDLEIVKSKKYNYIKVVNKEYGDLVQLLQVLVEKSGCDLTGNDLIIHIPE